MSKKNGFGCFLISLLISPLSLHVKSEMSAGHQQGGWLCSPLNSPARQTLASAFSPLSVEHGGQARFGLFVILLHLNPLARNHSWGKEKRKSSTFCLSGHKSIVYRGPVGVYNPCVFPISPFSARTQEKYLFWARRMRWGQVFPLAQRVTEASRQ